MVMVAFPSSGSVEHRVLLARTGRRDFSDRDMLLLSLVRPQLATLQETLLRAAAQPPLLTPRQRDLLHQVAAGLTNRQIARNSGISEGTVRKHLENIYDRLEVTNRAAAIARIRQALPSPQSWQGLSGT